MSIETEEANFDDEFPEDDSITPRTILIFSLAVIAFIAILGFCTWIGGLQNK